MSAVPQGALEEAQLISWPTAGKVSVSEPVTAAAPWPAANLQFMLLVSHLGQTGM